MQFTKFILTSTLILIHSCQDMDRAAESKGDSQTTGNGGIFLNAGSEGTVNQFGLQGEQSRRYSPFYLDQSYRPITQSMYYPPPYYPPPYCVNEGLKAYYQDVGTYGNPTNETPSTTQAENSLANNILQGDDSKNDKAPLPMSGSSPVGDSQVKEVAPKTGKQLDPVSGPQNDAQSKNNASTNPTDVKISKDAISKAINEIANPQSNSNVNPITTLNSAIVAGNAQQISDIFKAEQNDPSLQQAGQLLASQSKDGADASKLQQALESAMQNNPQNQQAVDNLATVLINGDDKGYDKIRDTTLDVFKSNPGTADTMENNLFKFFKDSGNNALFADVVQNLAHQDKDFRNLLLSSMFADAFRANPESDQQQGPIPQPQKGGQPQIPVSPPSNSPPSSPDQTPTEIPVNIPNPLPDQSKGKPLEPSITNIPNIPAPPSGNNAEGSQSNSTNKPPIQDQVPETNSPLENNGDKSDKAQPNTPPKDTSSQGGNTNPSQPGSDGELPPLDKGLMDVLKAGPPTDEAGVQKMMKALEDAQKNSNPSSNTDSKPKFFSDSNKSNNNNLGDSQGQQPVSAPQPAQIPFTQQRMGSIPSPQGGFQGQQAPVYNGQQFQGTFNTNSFAIPSSFQTQPQYYQPQYQSFSQSPYYGY
ncbi:hypothetical protein CONCODRAFT_15304 [Conidiobolus coronatus NRRL 28638]|uniref:Uncharacterized protein n=1 Tax=Conidiobolus coronatus (strain ATCC 28846 / CBS 209.66 / NRRL 28638) TaxID=796925 RepID=A0A137PFR8_CONC2|nr:hypothetical protein CONCODRAFT_15304 [Conidiobolus coronatus NRRL 28638]|eukprot:KXN73832.1 hypothetical protein CONCODRAFT_15304 [Conidiobolus coronatus NRRL 28638]